MCLFHKILGELASTEDPDPTLGASDPGLHCLCTFLPEKLVYEVLGQLPYSSNSPTGHQWGILIDIDINES